MWTPSLGVKLEFFILGNISLLKPTSSGHLLKYDFLSGFVSISGIDWWGLLTNNKQKKQLVLDKVTIVPETELFCFWTAIN